MRWVVRAGLAGVALGTTRHEELARGRNAWQATRAIRNQPHAHECIGWRRTYSSTDNRGTRLPRITLGHE